MKKILSIFVLYFFLTGSVDFALARSGGFSSSGSSGHSSFSGTGSKSSSSFSGTGSKGAVSTFSGTGTGNKSSGVFVAPKTAPRSGFDSAAGKAKVQEQSARNFSGWKASHGIAETKYSRNMYSSRDTRERAYFQGRQPTGYYVRPTNTIVVYRDHYNNNFLMYASVFWMFNHWDSMDHSRFQEAKIRELELKFKELEAQGKKRDPNYVDPGVDRDLQYAKSSVDYGHETGVGSIILIVVCFLVFIALVIWATWLIFFRKR